MKKCWVIVPALYLYFELLTAMFPVLISQTGASLPSEVDAWLNANYLVAAVSCFFVLTLTLLTAGTFFAAFSVKRPPISRPKSVALMKTQMIMRLAQIPGFVFAFVASIWFFLFIFTMGFSIYFVILGSASILITGLFSIPVYTSLYKNELINKDRMICYCILSFVFCADVVVAVRCYRQVKGRGDN